MKTLLSNLFGINVWVKVTNPAVVVSWIGAVLAIMLTYVGMNWVEVTTWPLFLSVFIMALSNPGCVVAILSMTYAMLISGDTPGVRDSVVTLAKTSYTETAAEALKSIETQEALDGLVAKHKLNTENINSDKLGV